MKTLHTAWATTSEGSPHDAVAEAGVAILAKMVAALASGLHPREMRGGCTMMAEGMPNMRLAITLEIGVDAEELPTAGNA